MVSHTTHGPSLLGALGMVTLIALINGACAPRSDNFFSSASYGTGISKEQGVTSVFMSPDAINR